MLLSNTGPCATNHGKPDLPKRVLEHWGEREFFDSLLNGWFSRPVPPLLRFRLLDYMGQVDFREGLKLFHKPVVLVHGTLDKTRTLDHVNMIREAMPQTKVFFMEAGHTSVVESKAECRLLCGI